MTPTPAVDHLLALETPFGRPVQWADVALVSDIGDSHELNDDRCLVVTSTDLGEHAPGTTEFMLCLLADGATGSTFGPGSRGGDPPKPAGWRASQLAQAAFVESFLDSAEVDILDRLKDGLRAADRTLSDSTEGALSTTLVALYLSADGTAYAASIGDSALLVLPPRRKTPGDRRLKKLGYEDSTSVGSGDTTLASLAADECIEQWWPHKEDGASTMRVAPGTFMVLMSDGISDNLPAELIDQLLHRHPLDRATIGLPLQTRARRAETHKLSGASTQQLGLDNMSAIVVRFDGRRRATRPAALPSLADGSLVTVLGTRGGPAPEAGGQFGMVCLADGSERSVVPAFLRHFVESEGTDGDRLGTAFLKASPHAPAATRAGFRVLAVDEQGQSHTFSAGGASVGPGTDVPVRIAARAVIPPRETSLQRLVRTPSIWGPAIAALAIFALVSTAFATGTVRPAPPPVPTPRPGEPRPTADTRPSLLIGGFVLQPPVQPTPGPDAPAQAQADTPAAGGDDQPTDEPVQAEPPAPAEPLVPAESPCTNLLGIGCQPPAPPPALPARPAPAPINRAIPVPSPAPQEDTGLDDLHAATFAPPPGSQLATALQSASVANENFAREVHPGSR